MLVFFDTEFIDAPPSLVPLSIGAVRADGREFYAEFVADTAQASPWVRQNILPTLTGPKQTQAEVARALIQFCGDEPEFWAHYAAYDWVVMCGLFGGLMALPPGWPAYVRDLRCLMDDCGRWIEDTHADQHNALSDARWVRDTWMTLKGWRV